MITTKTQPEDFKRRVLLAVAGGSPAILTETLYALTQTSQPAYLPTEIHIITTAGVYAGLKEKLLGTTGKIQALCADYHFPYPTFSEDQICRITDKNGQYLNDITTEADNETAADFITNKVRELTQDDAASLYVSIAGGRKTMSYYLGYAMSVFGRIQDRMSHVLVDDRYMSADFYYPTPQTQMMQPFKGEPFDASQVPIMLGELPFIRLRDGLTDDFLNDKTKSYSDIIKIAQRQLKPLSILVTAGDSPTLRCGNENIKLEIAELAQYLWLLENHRKDPSYRVSFRTTPQQRRYFADFFTVYKRLSDESEHYTKAYNSGTKAFVKAFRERNSRIKNKLEEELGKPRAKQYLIQSEKSGGGKAYFLSPLLTAKDIEIPFHKF